MGRTSRCRRSAWLSALLLVVFGYTAAATGPEVLTSSGVVRGKQESIEFLGKEYNVSLFYGIPFAEAPVGPLRFQKPVAKSNWSGILDATEFGPSCMQPMTRARLKYLPNKNISEDCLTLNVYVPTGTTSGDRKAVMVFIHGGGYRTGQAMEYDGRRLATFGDVIVVSPNYRLSLFGFLKVGDSWNNGLWDQNLALKWVQGNIMRFGGDPDQVTIFGGSTGGFSVTSHAVSPASRGLFHRVISESGTLLTAKMMIHDPTETVTAIATDVGCPDNDVSRIECLRNKTADELLAANEKLQSSKATMRYYYAPIIDGDIFPVNMYEYFGYLRRKNHATKPDLYENLGRVDYMAGFNSQEGSNLLSMLRGLEKSLGYDLDLGVTEQVVDTMLKLYSEDFFPDKAEAVQAALVDSYFGGSLRGKTRVDLATHLLDAHADIVFNAGTVALLNAHWKASGSGSRYLYRFSHEYLPRMSGRPAWFHGAGHTDERLFVFATPLVTWPQVNLTTEENKIAAAMMTYWSNFAKTGDPNDPGKLYLQTWNQYSPKKPQFMQLGSPRDLYKERMKFWLDDVLNVVPKIPTSKAAVYNPSSLTVWGLLVLVYLLKTAGS